MPNVSNVCTYLWSICKYLCIRGKSKCILKRYRRFSVLLFRVLLLPLARQVSSDSLLLHFIEIGRKGGGGCRQWSPVGNGCWIHAGKICETKAHPREYMRRCTRDTLSPAYICMRVPLLRIEKRCDWAIRIVRIWDFRKTIRSLSCLLFPRNTTNELNDLRLTLIWIEILAMYILVFPHFLSIFNNILRYLLAKAKFAWKQYVFNDFETWKK